MGLVVRLYDIVSPNDFDLKIGLSPYAFNNPNLENTEWWKLNGPNLNNSWPGSTSGTTTSTERNYRTDPIYIGDNDPEVVNGDPPSSNITYYDLEFDTQYWIRIEDKENVINRFNEETGLCDGDNNPRFITENIFIHDSKAFECYDKINFSLSYQCNP